MSILRQEGMVRHEREGRAYRDYPVVAQDEAGGHALRRIADKLFQGSAGLADAMPVGPSLLTVGCAQRPAVRHHLEAQRLLLEGLHQLLIQSGNPGHVAEL